MTTIEPMDEERKRKKINDIILELRRIIDNNVNNNQVHIDNAANELQEWMNAGMNFGKSRKSRRKNKKRKSKRPRKYSS